MIQLGGRVKISDTIKGPTDHGLKIIYITLFVSQKHFLKGLRLNYHSWIQSPCHFCLAFRAFSAAVPPCPEWEDCAIEPVLAPHSSPPPAQQACPPLPNPLPAPPASFSGLPTPPQPPLSTAVAVGPDCDVTIGPKIRQPVLRPAYIDLPINWERHNGQK